VALAAAVRQAALLREDLVDIETEKKPGELCGSRTFFGIAAKSRIPLVELLWRPKKSSMKGEICARPSSSINVYSRALMPQAIDWEGHHAKPFLSSWHDGSSIISPAFFRSLLARVEPRYV